jgi:hypothetical protein
MKPGRAVAVFALFADAIYWRWFRRPVLTWGATAAEADGGLPGDELLEHADGVATRAIEIDAPASAVWPWLAQRTATGSGLSS